ncbi:MAG: hypothetical protein AAFQ90_09840 [Pseudomonadota bacterium]
MTRQLLTFLALLSGLAALHAPANASQLDKLPYDVEALADLADAKSGVICQCQNPPRKQRLLCIQQQLRALRPRLMGTLPPSIVVGADRALE